MWCLWGPEIRTGWGDVGRHLEQRGKESPPSKGEPCHGGPHAEKTNVSFPDLAGVVVLDVSFEMEANYEELLFIRI